ncbi:hypothetical protein TARUN_5923 [Trichoderma arundinaceum]|uniref:GST N-terminal domain-containing protein n=1 Tax=Trichoderma arundinaceum TaxID=490622 RepID=A0A395NKI0_TRIAR|nr:hypothetical protein TARUN_5923 [Trichoderma arundinaceum]
MVAPGGPFAASSGGQQQQQQQQHFLGVGMDFGAEQMGEYSGLEEAYHGQSGAGAAANGDADAGDGGNINNSNHSGTSNDGSGGNNNSHNHGAGSGNGSSRQSAVLEVGRRGRRGGFGRYQDARHERAIAQHQQQLQRQLPAPPGHHQHHQHHTYHDTHQQQRQATAGQFGILMPTPMPASMPEDEVSHLQHREQDHVRYDRHQNAVATAAAAAVPYKLGQGKLVIDPPDLQAWREKLFHVDHVIILTHEQFETYFPHIDNVYSHRSTQRYKRKPFISHYWDCRMKGRPPGTPKSDDPNKKKRKRSARERDLCDVKIKITEYFPDAGAEAALDQEVAAAIAAGTPASAVVGTGQRFWTIQRVNGNGGNGKGDGVAGSHRHTLERSDEIKKSSVQRFVATRDKEAKKTHVSMTRDERSVCRRCKSADELWQRTPQKKATGAAQATVRMHSQEADLKLYAACFCPFSQRVWIALEAKGQPYQYIETDPFRRPASTTLLEANPRGCVPAVRQGDWACSKSAVILEYVGNPSDFEDVYPDIPLFPSDPRLRANCRLWIDHINTRLVPLFFSLLQSSPPPSASQTAISSSTAPSSSDTTSSLALFQSHLTALVLAADEQGPYFLGPSLSLVDIQFAPFALRLGRILRRRHPSALLTDPALSTRWHRWLGALETDLHVAATISTDDFYLDTANLLAQTSSEGG